MLRFVEFVLCVCIVLLAPAFGYADKPELIVQTGHTNAINSVAFSPDGSLLATGSHDTTIKLWDVKVGLQVRTLAGHSAIVTSITFTSDGKTLVSGSLDGTIRIWDTKTGDIVRVLPQSGSINSIDISPDGKIVAGGGWANEVTLWSLNDGSQIRVLRGHSDHVTTVAFNGDGNLLATGSDDYSIRFWDIDSGREVRTIKLQSPSDRPQLFTNINTGGPIKPPVAIDSVNSVQFSPDGKKLASLSFALRNFDLNGIDFTIKLWDVETGKENHTFETFRGGGPTHAFLFENRGDQNALVGSVSFSKDGATLVALGADYTVKIWDAKSGKPLKRIPVLATGDDAAKSQQFIKEIEKFTWQFNPHLPTFSPDGKYLAIVVESSVALWDIATGESFLAFSPRGKSVSAVAFHQDGKILASAISGSQTRLWDLGAGRVLRTLGRPDFPKSAFAVAFSPVQQLLATASANVFRSTATIDIWDSNTGEKLRSFEGSATGRFSIAFRPASKDLAVGRLGDAVSLWDVVTGKKIRDLDKTSFLHNYVAWSPDGRILAHAIDGRATSAPITITSEFSPIGNPDIKKLFDTSAFIKLWDVRTGREIRKMSIEKDHSFYSIAFSPDNEILAGASENTVYLWSVQTSQKPREIKIDENTFYSVAFSPDSRILAGGGTNGIIYFWDVATGGRVAILNGHAAAVTSIAFNTDGNILASGSTDGTIRLWNVGSRKEICAFIPIDRTDYLTATPDNYYISSKSGLRGVAARLGNRVFPFEQFDLRLNRPDIVLQRLGIQDSKLIKAYRAAYLKRLEKMHFTEAMLNDDFHLPELSISPPSLPPLKTSNGILSFSVKAVDSKYLLDRVNVWVNDVPANGTMNGRSFVGSQGYNLLNDRVSTFEGNIALPLSVGKNKVQVSVLNGPGVESLKQTFSVTYIPPSPTPKPDLYVVSIGVSRYRESRYNLDFAAKDATDLANFFSEKSRDHFSRVRVLLLKDERASRDSILQLTRQLLKETKVDDQVILFLAGHGILDEKLDYYFGTYDMDFAYPKQKGLPYDAIEEMLDGIAARKKLLLIDTCHAGEVDKGGTVALTERKGLSPRVKAAAVRADPGKSYVGLGNSFLLMQELFADLRRGSGAEVIAAAAGVQIAIETDAAKNGLFTHALLEGLRDRKADQDRDGNVLVSELRDWVISQVQDLSGGRQVPTTRRENAELDWSIR